MSDQQWEPYLTRLEDACERTDRRLGDLRSRMDAGFDQIESQFAQIDGRFAQIDGRFVQIDGGFVQIDGRFAQISGGFGTLERKLDTMHWRLSAVVIGTWATTLLTIVFHH